MCAQKLFCDESYPCDVKITEQTIIIVEQYLTSIPQESGN